MEIVGWIGSSLLAFCALPEFISSLVTKKSKTPLTLLLPWLIGEILCAIYGTANLGIANPLVMNYYVNVVLVSVILKYRIAGGDVK